MFCMNWKPQAIEKTFFEMPSQILCNGTQQKSQEARPGLSLAPSRYTSLHNIRYGIQVSVVYEQAICNKTKSKEHSFHLREEHTDGKSS